MMLPFIGTARLINHSSRIILQQSVNLFHSSQVSYKSKSGCNPPKVAVILCGCGVLDGTEISEAMSASFHVSNKNMIPRFYAPNINICGTVDHLSKEPDESPPRNALVEAARLARGAIQPLCDCHACEHAALIIPGGWGAARTMSDFASKGCDCIVLPELIKVIKDFNCDGKPIGSMCIASAILAKVLNGVKVTLGKDRPTDQWIYAEAITKVTQMGAKIEMRDVKDVTHCREFNVFSTPAWMDTHASYADVHQGIGKMVTMMRQCIN